MGNDTSIDIKELKAKALAATACNLDTAEMVLDRTETEEWECPLCGGEGFVPGGMDYRNIDAVAIGVQFYGIGNEPEASEAYFRAANPVAVLEIIDRMERAEHQVKDLKVQREDLLAVAGDILRLHEQRDQLLEALKSLTDKLRGVNGGVGYWVDEAIIDADAAIAKAGA